METVRKGPLSETQITQWLLDLRHHSHVPESGFTATAVFRADLNGADEYYFAGVNVENADHRISTHGEEGSIAAIITGLGKHARITEGWVMGAPKEAVPGNSAAADALASCCGKCRQQIAGLAGKSVKIHAVSLNGRVSTTTVGDFLPDTFSLQKCAAGPKKTDAPAFSAEKIVRRGNLSDKDIFDWLQEIESIDYFSKVSQAIVLQLSSGAYAAGTKVEDAAFVGMNAAQSALANAVTAFGMNKVRGVWVYTKGHEGQERPERDWGTLTLSALQVLTPVTEGDSVPVVFFSPAGSPKKMTLSQAVSAAVAVRVAAG